MSHRKMSKLDSRNVQISYLKVDPNYTGSKLSNQALFNGGQPVGDDSRRTSKTFVADDLTASPILTSSTGVKPPEQRSKGYSSNSLLPHLLTVEFETENSNRITYFVMSCLVATFISPLFGLVAVLFSLKSHKLFMTRTVSGRKKAHFYGRVAFTMNVLGIMVTMISLIVFFFYMGETADNVKFENAESIDLETTLSPNKL